MNLSTFATRQGLRDMLQEWTIQYKVHTAVGGGIFLLFLTLAHLTARKRYNKKLLGLTKSHISLQSTHATIKKVTDNVYFAYLDRPMVVFLSPVSKTLLIANPIALEESQMRFFEDMTSVSSYEDAVSVIISTSRGDDTNFYRLRYPNAKVFRSVQAYEAFVSRHTEFSQVALQRPHHRTDDCGDALVLINDIAAVDDHKRKKDKTSSSHANNVMCFLPRSFKGSNKITCNRFMKEAFADTLMSMTMTTQSQKLASTKTKMGKNVFLGLSPNTLITYQGEVFLGREMCDAILMAGAEALQPGSTIDLREY